MHKQNIISLSSTPHIDSGFKEIAVVYQSAEGGETEDVTKALKDYDGNPLVVELKSSTKVLESTATPPKPLTLSPADPFSRSQCIEVFGLLNKRPSSPVSMIDKMDAAKYADNVSGAISNAIQTAVDKVQTPQPSLTNE